MMGRTHALGGLASLWLLNTIPGVLTTTAETNNLGVLAVCAVFGALFPDLDAPKSLLSTFSFNRKGITPFSLPAQMISSTLKHRGPLHSLVGCAVSTLVVGIPLAYYLGGASVTAFVLGFLSHLVLDCLTISGLPLLWPRRTSVWLLPRTLRMVTGSVPEDIVFFMLAIAVITLFLSYFPALLSAGSSSAAP